MQLDCFTALHWVKYSFLQLLAKIMILDKIVTIPSRYMCHTAASSQVHTGMKDSCAVTLGGKLIVADDDHEESTQTQHIFFYYYLQNRNYQVKKFFFFTK